MQWGVNPPTPDPLRGGCNKLQGACTLRVLPALPPLKMTDGVAPVNVKKGGRLRAPSVNALGYAPLAHTPALRAALLHQDLVRGRDTQDVSLVPVVATRPGHLCEQDATDLVVSETRV